MFINLPSLSKMQMLLYYYKIMLITIHHNSSKHPQPRSQGLSSSHHQERERASGDEKKRDPEKQCCRAPSSSFSEIAFWRLPSVEWSPPRQIWSPKSKRFQRRTLRVTLHGANTADHDKPTLNRSKNVSMLIVFVCNCFVFVEQSTTVQESK